jgi:hypothetical protein
LRVQPGFIFLQYGISGFNQAPAALSIVTTTPVTLKLSVASITSYRPQCHGKRSRSETLPVIGCISSAKLKALTPLGAALNAFP